MVPFFDLQNFILLVRTVPFLRKIIFISSYTAKNNYFLLYELIQDLPYVKNQLSKIIGGTQIITNKRKNTFFNDINSLFLAVSAVLNIFIVKTLT